MIAINDAALAQEKFKHWEFKAFAGYNTGGATPLPLPAEIRKINSWSPGFSAALAFHATRWITPEWGVTSGLAIDLKGMSIRADVKYMMTSLVVGEGDNTGTFTGMFTGKNKTTIRNGYLVLPVLAAYKPHEKWTFRLGGYFASQRDANFEGNASDGYIRNGGAAGDRINIEKATFDFSDEVRKIDAGLMASADWFFTKKMAVTGQLSWGLVPIFPSDFNGIPYKMYNVYFMTGIAYKL
jgi:hypothetical protein